jgi:hypothetical protein
MVMPGTAGSTAWAWLTSAVVTVLLLGVAARPAEARARAAVTVAGAGAGVGAGTGAGAGARGSQSGAPRKKRAPAPAPADHKSRVGRQKAPGRKPGQDATGNREDTAERAGASAADPEEVVGQTDSVHGSPTPAGSPRSAGDETEAGAGPGGPTPPGKASRTKVYSFGAMDVEGKLKTPQLLYFLNRVKLELDMSAQAERSFMKELARTADDPNL